MHFVDMDIENISVEVSTKLFECGICGKQYQSKWALQRHLRRHTDENKFDCNECDNRYYLGNCFLRKFVSPFLTFVSIRPLLFAR